VAFGREKQRSKGVLLSFCGVPMFHLTVKYGRSNGSAREGKKFPWRIHREDLKLGCYKGKSNFFDATQLIFSCSISLIINLLMWCNI
jgi:hypothetical protein